jgi:cupin fold WbuC family metalloprotein
MIKIDKKLLTGIKEKSNKSPRKRCNHNFHQCPSDTLQRMLNVMNPDTYIRPHKHENPDKREAFIILEGKVIVVEFNEKGIPVESIILSHECENYGCEISPRCWHTIVCLEKNSVLYEVKDGPYDVATDKKFADWAPEEGDPKSTEYNTKLLKRLDLIH